MQNVYFTELQSIFYNDFPSENFRYSIEIISNYFHKKLRFNARKYKFITFRAYK